MADTTHPREITLPYIDLSGVDFGALTMADLDTRWHVLAKLGIERRDDVSPLAAWRDFVADTNNIPRAELDPAQGGSLDLGFSSEAVRRFVWFLA